MTSYKLKKKWLAASLILSLSAPSLVLGAEPSNVPLVPLRLLSEENGATVNWNPNTYTATITFHGIHLSIAKNSDKALYNGKVIPMPEKAQIVNGRLMVPSSVLELLFASQNAEKAGMKAAEAFVENLQKGKFQQALRDFSPALGKVVDENRMEKYWTALPQQMNAGALKNIGEAKLKETNAVHTNIEIPLVFEKATVPFIVRLNKEGQIDDFSIYLFPTSGMIAGEPKYSNPDTFTEEEVVIGDGVFALPGTLTIPKGEGPFPVVILVQGSGPLDRDETAFALKPFRDLAHGLASKQIAVLRYNKRTFQHAAKTIFDPGHTVDKETTDDALYAVDLLLKKEKIDKNQIYILGHSQGGMIVPRILEKGMDKPITGAIVMAGPARTLPDIMLDQFQYLTSIGQLPKEQYESLKKQVELLKSPSFSGQNPPQEFQMGQPMFWDSIRNIKAAEMAKNQNKPLLIIQGERDYQVPAQTEIPIWKGTLSVRDNIVYKVYSKLNHFFTEGEGGLSKPEEYFKPANIPDYVIDDIASWVTASHH